MTTGLKTCNKCQTEKPFDAFGRLADAKDGMTYACLDCVRSKMRVWRENNRDRDRVAKNRWAMQNAEKLKEKSRLYYAENTEKHKAACRRWEDENRANRRKYVYAWVEKNKSQKYAWNANRRAKKMNATPPWLTAIHMAQIQEMYDVAEALLVQTGVPHHVDHIHPLNGDGFNGLHVPWNLQVIPAFDNLSKHNFLPAEDQHMMWGATQ
jgi:hypothetical protein